MITRQGYAPAASVYCLPRVDRVDHLADLFFVHFRKAGDRNDLARQTFGFRQLDRNRSSVGRLPVIRYGVVNVRGDPARLEVTAQSVAVFATKHEQMSYVVR